MVWRIVKMILAVANVKVTFSDGDMLRVEISLGDKLVMDKTIDLIPGA